MHSGLEGYYVRVLVAHMLKQERRFLLDGSEVACILCLLYPFETIR